MSVEVYDYIVCGAGSAGCVLANRLSVNHTVLLLEAGVHVDRWLSAIPTFMLNNFHAGDIDWGYKTLPEPGLNNRIIPVERGKCLGGSSMINGMLYCRGHPADYDRWAVLTGCEEWRYSNCLPLFKKTQDHIHRRDDPFHGTQGEIQIRTTIKTHEINSLFLEAASDAGLPATKDCNGEQYEGLCYIDQYVDEDGKRSDQYNALISPIKDSRANLTVKTGVLIDRVIFEGNQAVGVKCRWEKDSEEVTFRSSKEVILSAGTYGSPCILQRSGIGNQELLTRLGIDVLQHLPGVGQNLFDHARAHIGLELEPGHSGIEKLGMMQASMAEKFAGRMDSITTTEMRALMKDIGVCDFQNLCNIQGMIKSSPDLDRPDMQVYFILGNPGNFNYDHTHDHLDMCMFLAICQDPQSVGHIEIASRDPGEVPRILHNYLKDYRDLESLRRTLQIGRRIMLQDPMKGVIKQEMVPGGDDGQISDDYLRNTTSHLYHPVGTCKMGRSDDVTAVCDGTGRVRGLGGLRVCDASIMPKIPTANTNAATVMIAERISLFILQGS